MKKSQQRVSRPAGKPFGYLCIGGVITPPVGSVVAAAGAGVAGIETVAAAGMAATAAVAVAGDIAAAVTAAATGVGAAHIAAGMAATATGAGAAHAAALAAGVAAGIGNEIGELNTGNTVPGGPVAGVTGIAGHKKSSSA